MVVGVVASLIRGRIAVFLRLCGWVPLLMLAAGFLIAIPVTTDLLRAVDLQTHGATVPGQVTSLTQSHQSCGKRHRSTCDDYVVAYQFALGDHQIQGRETVSQDFFAKVHERDVIPVRYATDDPFINEVESGATLNNALAPGFFLLVWFSILGVWSVRALIAATRMVYLREHGTQRNSRVTDHTDSKVKVNGVRYWKMTWRDETGLSGESWPRSRENLPEVGEAIIVYVDPEMRMPPCWSGDSGLSTRDRGPIS